MTNFRVLKNLPTFGQEVKKKLNFPMNRLSLKI